MLVETELWSSWGPGCMWRRDGNRLKMKVIRTGLWANRYLALCSYLMGRRALKHSKQKSTQSGVHSERWLQEQRCSSRKGSVTRGQIILGEAE